MTILTLPVDPSEKGRAPRRGGSRDCVVRASGVQGFLTAADHAGPPCCYTGPRVQKASQTRRVELARTTVLGDRRASSWVDCKATRAVSQSEADTFPNGASRRRSIIGRVRPPGASSGCRSWHDRCEHKHEEQASGESRPREHGWTLPRQHCFTVAKRSRGFNRQTERTIRLRSGGSRIRRRLTKGA